MRLLYSKLLFFGDFYLLWGLQDAFHFYGLQDALVCSYEVGLVLEGGAKSYKEVGDVGQVGLCLSVPGVMEAGR